MSISDLIRMTTARQSYLSQLRTSAVAIGDTDTVARLDAELATIEETLAKLNAVD